MKKFLTTAPVFSAIWFAITAGIGGFLACALSGFACGFLGGIPMILLETARALATTADLHDPLTASLLRKRCAASTCS